MQTDANQGGIEKLSICETHPSYKCQRCGIAADDLSPDCVGLLPPMGVFMVKGWTRGVCAITVLLCAFQCEEFMTSLPLEVRQLLGI